MKREWQRDGAGTALKAGTGSQAKKPQIFTSSSQEAVKPCLKLFLAPQADDLLGYLALMEEQQSGDVHDTKLTSQLLLVIHINLANLHPPVVFAGQFVKNRRQHLTRAAPLRPKINQDGHSGLDDIFGEVFLRQNKDIWS
jgi:hypothetical protein